MRSYRAERVEAFASRELDVFSLDVTRRYVIQTGVSGDVVEGVLASDMTGRVCR